MTTRLAACDTCRRAKVACDHARPVCMRCVDNQKADSCVYRTSPFKKRPRANAPFAHLVQQTSQGTSPPVNPPNTSSLGRNPYPNPGHQGSSSHVAIFSQISSTEGALLGIEPTCNPVSQIQVATTRSVELDHETRETAKSLQQLLDHCSLSSMKDLVVFWHAKGVNLAVAEPMVDQCINAVVSFQELFHELSLEQQAEPNLSLIMHLLQNSEQPLEYTATTKLAEFVRQFCDHNARLETLGIFLMAVSRATIDVPIFPPLYLTDEARYRLRWLTTRLSDRIVALCLSLDCLNDLQLILQYEHFIVHSNVSGDQTFALGYHENLSNKPGIPPFLVELRTTAFARIYSNDKSFAIFLGRPPRMSKRFAHFQIPSGHPDWDASDISGRPLYGALDWDPEAQISYRVEARWSALCASLKEEILELLFDGQKDHDEQKAREITRKAEAFWRALPAHLRLNTSLNQRNQSPFECDFLLNIRLNYLQVQFLLRLVLLTSLTEPNDAILDIAEQILALVVEGVLYRECLGNSGSGIVWKIAQFGLPAAGLILLAALRRRQLFEAGIYPRRRVWRDLSILVAEVQMGSVVRLGDANYALLSTATQTIQSFLQSLESEEEFRRLPDATRQQGDTEVDGVIPFHLSPDPWNLEMGFWQELAEHPFLAAELPLQDPDVVLH